MTALATQTDLTARIGALTVAQAARADALLSDASDIIRAGLGQTISQVVDDQQVLTAAWGVIRLPQRPVTAVTSVALIDGATSITVTGWTWDGLDLIDLGRATTSTAPVSDAQTFRVTYTHGYPPGQIPGLLLSIVCGAAARTLTAPSLVDGLTGETIGQYSYQLQQGAGAAGTAVRITQAEWDLLARAGFKRRSATVHVRAR